MPVCLVQGDDAGTAVEGALQMVGVGVELVGAKPVDEFNDGGVPYGDSCEPHSALLHESKCHPAGSAAQGERTQEGAKR